MASTLITPPPERALIRNPIYIEVESDNFSGSEPPYTPDEVNLKCRIEVWSDGEMLGRCTAPYSRITKRATFDIASLFRRDIDLPSEASIGISDSDPMWAEAPTITKLYTIKHADQYGDPVEPEEMAESEEYLAINGGLPADAIQELNWAGTVIALHSYFWRRHGASFYFKPVGSHQPDWLYFVALITGPIDVVITIHYRDGSFDNVTSHQMEVEAFKAYWMQSGFSQLKVIDLADSDKQIAGYTVNLVDEGGDRNPFNQAHYKIDDECPEWQRYLLMHNGLGGYESVRMKGKTVYTHHVDPVRFERTRWVDFDTKTGLIDNITALGHPVFNTHTGFYEPWYLDHLRQLLHGRLWLIDTSLAHADEYYFKRIICETNDVQIRQDDPGRPEGFAIQWRQAWLDDGFNVY